MENKEKIITIIKKTMDREDLQYLPLQQKFSFQNLDGDERERGERLRDKSE